MVGELHPTTTSVPVAFGKLIGSRGYASLSEVLNYLRDGPVVTVIVGGDVARFRWMVGECLFGRGNLYSSGGLKRAEVRLSRPRQGATGAGLASLTTLSCQSPAPPSGGLSTLSSRPNQIHI